VDSAMTLAAAQFIQRKPPRGHWASLNSVFLAASSLQPCPGIESGRIAAARTD